MPGKWKIVLSVAIILATASAASARCRVMPAGPEWYLDDRGCWHSIRADWAGIQRHPRARRSRPSEYGTDSEQ
jgi:hypothetical protein